MHLNYIFEFNDNLPQENDGDDVGKRCLYS